MRYTSEIPVVLVALAILVAVVALAPASPAGAKLLELPSAEAGLSERQAAAHLLDRLAFGARPGDVDRVVEMGLANWLEIQLGGRAQEQRLPSRLAQLSALGLSRDEIVATYPNPGMLVRQAVRQGKLSRPPQDPDGLEREERRELRQAMMEIAADEGYRPQRELIGQLLAQKLWRAVYAENQLVEVLTDFWFNHFNVSLTHNQARPYLLAYERDTIRPRVLGSFPELVAATAMDPAMLLYLDNARSRADEGRRSTLDHRLATRAPFADRRSRRRPQAERASRGLNENYARELLELHTLGVDGGYSQRDVVEVARAFTGWMALPPGPQQRQRIEEQLARAGRFGGGAALGFVRQGEFVFSPEAHDAEKKVVLGRRLAAGRGIEDGLEVLEIVSLHPSTAHHLASKLAVRFVADRPPEALVKRLASTFSRTGGDLTAVLRDLVSAPEFWTEEARRQKIKSPFELAATALRALGAEVHNPRQVVEWIERMGQPLYAYQAPTGYPDRATAWVNTGSLLNRMNFGLELASGRLRGVDFDLLELNRGHEPESLDGALAAYAALLLPGRDLEETLRLLQPVVRDPELVRKVETAAAASAPAVADASEASSDEAWHELERMAPADEPTAARGWRGGERELAQVVGVILGSPEFQRR